MLASTYGHNASVVSVGTAGKARQHNLNLTPEPHGQTSSLPGECIGGGLTPAEFSGRPFQMARVQAKASARASVGLPWTGESNVA